MKTSTSEGKHGIQWTARIQSDLDFTDDLDLLSRTREQMQTTSESEASVSVGINIHKSKSKILKYNTENTNPITHDGDSATQKNSRTWSASLINMEDQIQT
ncbi:unnamed protein product [Schistosoma curassoni]|uniref:Reverse transcriptase domain-containing protein n=1 Tax=Schistosoma curassoni TaxID=6186 RepID=A0A183JZQ8_9TREM|nr:unnamed protein product [Schistosoma curassoni]